MLKKHISTSVLSVQHPNASWNIQHFTIHCLEAWLNLFFIWPVLYPIVPILAYANLLWMKPKSNSLAEENAFREAEYRSVIAHSISGCIESPIQLIYQVHIFSVTKNTHDFWKSYKCKKNVHEFWAIYVTSFFSTSYYITSDWYQK